MQIDAHKRTLGEVLQQGQHLVPRYQRGYAWESQNIRDFFNDITSSTDPHFLGSMVTSGATSEPREVIDGQQRLTTAIVCLSVLRDLYIEYGHTQRVRGINEYLEFIDRNGDRNRRLRNRDTSAAARLNDNIILEKSRRSAAPSYDPNALESQAYATFEKLVRDKLALEGDSARALDDVRDAILESEVVYINVEDRKNAFTIFETLNDRGKSLTVMDLVKNLLFAEIAGGDEDSTERAWAGIQDQVNEVSLEGMTLDVFLYYAWNSRHHAKHNATDIIEQARIRRSIADSIDDSDDRDAAAREVVKGLGADAAALLALDRTLTSNGSPDAWSEIDHNWRRDKYEPIANSVYGILVSGSSQPLPLLISLVRARLQTQGAISHKVLLEFLESVENFQFRWSIAQRPSTSTIRRLYRQTASAVSSSRTTADYRAALSQFLNGASKIDASDAQFRDGISRLVYSRTRAKDAFKIRHLLTRIEKSFNFTRLDLSKQLSIEHLQGLEGRSEATPRNSWIFKIGNLALLPPATNSTLPKKFDAKSSELAKWINPSDQVLTDAIEAKAWKADVASERLTWIAQQALTIWPRATS